MLARESLTNVLENYAQVVEAKDEKSGRKKRTQVWPRYHQLDVVRRLLADAAAHGVGRRYLIQHSAGSGKSNSIAWLAHQIIGLERDDAPVFDSIVVVTDRLILDRQIRDTIRQYAQVGATVGHAERSDNLRKFIASGKKIVVSHYTVCGLTLDALSGCQVRSRVASESRRLNVIDSPFPSMTLAVTDTRPVTHPRQEAAARRPAPPPAT